MKNCSPHDLIVPQGVFNDNMMDVDAGPEAAMLATTQIRDAALTVNNIQGCFNSKLNLVNDVLLTNLVFYRKNNKKMYFCFQH